MVGDDLFRYTHPGEDVGELMGDCHSPDVPEWYGLPHPISSKGSTSNPFRVTGIVNRLRAQGFGGSYLHPSK